MDVRTLTDLEALVSIDDTVTWGRRVLPAGTVVRSIEFENADPGVGIFSGTSSGIVDLDGGKAVADFGGTHWDWWGEPVTEPGGAPVPGWFETLDG